MAVSPAVNATPDSPPVVMTVCSIAYGEAAKLWSCGTFLCVHLPLRTLQLCWRTQLFLISFPFHCTYRMLGFVKQCAGKFLLGTKRDTPIKILQNFMECDLAEKQKVFQTVKELRAGSMLAISKMNALNRRVERYRRQVASWKKETEKHSRELSSAAAEERRLIRVIIGALKSLRRLKISKDAIDEKFSNNVKDICDFCKSASVNDLCERTSESITEINNFLKSGYERLNKQMELMRQLIDDKNFSEHGTETPHMYSSSSNYTESESNLQDYDANTHMNLLNLSMGTLDTVMSLLNAENVELKKRLRATNEHLMDMKDASVSLNEKIVSLESQLERVSELLRRVEADRNEMKEKLLTLQGMIEEEEVYLNYDASTDDSYNELYVTTKEFNFSDVETSSPTDNFGKIEHLELEWTSVESDDDSKDPKSLELSLSR